MAIVNGAAEYIVSLLNISERIEKHSAGVCQIPKEDAKDTMLHKSRVTPKGSQKKERTCQYQARRKSSLVMQNGTSRKAVAVSGREENHPQWA